MKSEKYFGKINITCKNTFNFVRGFKLQQKHCVQPNGFVC